MSALLRGAALAVALAGAARADDAGVLHGWLHDQCLPYVTTGAPPFAGLGEVVAPGDLVGIDGRMQQDAAGAARLEGGRFQVAWGETLQAEVPTRFCLIDATPGGGFALVPGTIRAGVEAVLEGSGLVAENEEPAKGPGALSWTTPGAVAYRGLRLVLVTDTGRVSMALMADDLD